jgi:hypothetical protein
MKLTPIIALLVLLNLYGAPDASKWDAPRNFHEKMESEDIERIKVKKIGSSLNRVGKDGPRCILPI